MGMYTELIFSAGFIKDLPDEVVDTLKYMISGEDRPEHLPSHEFFDSGAVTWLLRGRSYYFADTIDPRLRFDKIGKNWILSSRSNIKNYDNEIELFLDWIKPYIAEGSGLREFYAIVCHEEQEIPTIYYLHEEDEKHD